MPYLSISSVCLSVFFVLSFIVNKAISDSRRHPNTLTRRYSLIFFIQVVLRRSNALNKPGRINNTKFTFDVDKSLASQYCDDRLLSTSNVNFSLIRIINSTGFVQPIAPSSHNLNKNIISLLVRKKLFYSLHTYSNIQVLSLIFVVTRTRKLRQYYFNIMPPITHQIVDTFHWCNRSLIYVSYIKFDTNSTLRGIKYE